MKKWLLVTICICVSVFVHAQTWETDRARLQPDGSLTYAEDEKRNRIPDFSHAGYQGGGVAIPDIPVRMSICLLYTSDAADE